MKSIKLYNVIFPIWLLLFFPPIVFISLAGNFVIDSIVLIICFYIYNIQDLGLDLKTFYKKNILLVWIFGFAADFIGGLILFVTLIMDSFLGIPYDITSAISFNPFNNIVALLLVIFAMMVSGFFIYLFNNKLVLKKQISDKKLRFKVAITIAIITIPWTFLLPTKWFY